MRILIVTQYFWPENFRINDLAREMHERHHDVTVLTGIPNYPAGTIFPDFRSSPGRFADYHGVNVIRVPTMPRSTGHVRLAWNYLTFLCAATLLSPWKLRAYPFDVVLVFGVSPIMVVVPALVMGRLRGIPVVTWVLDLWPESVSAVGAVRSMWLLRLLERFVRLLYDHSALVLGQSRSFVAAISRRTRHPDRVRYFPSWAEEVFNDRPAYDGASDILACRQCFTIMFAGNIGEAQDIPSIVKAIEILRDAQVRWVFVGDGRRAPWLREQIAERQLAERVIMLGRRSLEEMPGLYAHADALLVSLKTDPALAMTIPGKVQSYLATGIPVIGMLDGEGAEVIRVANAGMVCASGDAVGLAACVSAMSALAEADRRQMGENGRAMANSEFHRATLMSRLEGYLMEAIASHRARHSSGAL